MEEGICCRPNDCRGFLHKKILGLGAKLLGVGASIVGGPALQLAGAGFRQIRGRGGIQRPPLAGTLPADFRVQVPTPGLAGKIQRFLPGGSTGFTTIPQSMFSGGRGGGERVPADIRNVVEAGQRMRAGSVQTNGCPPEAQVCAPRGFHLNKSSYFLRDGTFIPRGTKFVRNRRLNNANGRAQGKAIVRLEKGAENAKKLLKATGWRTISKQSSRELRMRRRGHR